MDFDYKEKDLDEYGGADDEKILDSDCEKILDSGYEKILDDGDAPADNPKEYTSKKSELCKEADRLYTQGKYESAFAKYKADCDASGSPYAYDGLGRCYLFGKGTAKNDRLAFDCLLKASRSNIPSALCNLGYCYEKGVGAPKDMAKAVDCYKSAAKSKSK